MSETNSDGIGPERAMLKALAESKDGETYYSDWFEKANKYTTIHKNQFERLRLQFLTMKRVTHRTGMHGRQEREYYKLVEMPINQQYLDEIEAALKALEPDKKQLTDLPKDEAQFLVNRYTSTISFYVLYFIIHYIYEINPDIRKYKIDEMIMPLLRKARKVADMLKEIDLQALREIYEQREKRTYLFGGANFPTLEQYRDSKKPPPPPKPPSAEDIQNDKKYTRIMDAMLKRMAKEFPEDKEIRELVAEFDEHAHESKSKPKPKKKSKKKH